MLARAMRSVYWRRAIPRVPIAYGAAALHRGAAVRERGFTLIEVLLATVLLAAGLGLAFATLGAATRTAQRGEALAQHNERMRAVAGFLRTRIGAARPIAFAQDPATGAPRRFIGSSDRIRFVADLPDYLGRGGPHLHDIFVEGDGDQARLQVVFSLVQNGMAVPEDPPREPEALVKEVAAVTFRYRGIGVDGLLGDWQDQWGDAEQLPLQVAVQVTGADDVAWPEVIIALPLAGSVGLSGAAGGLDLSL